MTDEERRQAAEQLILWFAREIEYISVREHLSEEIGDYSQEDVEAVYKLINNARIDVCWPY